MKFRDAIKQGMEKKDAKRRDADAREQAAARIKGGKPERRTMPLDLPRCTKPTIGKPPHCGDPTCHDHEGWS